MKQALPSLLALAASCLLPLAASAADKPNILWLTSEDHGPEMGCYGDKLARTPNVDALAAKGMLFNRAWSIYPVCAPARTCIISGLYAASTGAEHMRSLVPMPAGKQMYPQFLSAAGYYCTNNSKEDYNLAKPGKVWDESSGQAHWRNRQDAQPFFAIFNSTKSHESQLRTRPHTAITDPAKVRVPAYHPDLPEVRQDWAQYYDKVSEVDADAGERLKELAAAGLVDETIVFYFGDHGSGMSRSKRWPSNSGLHVPLVVYFPEKWKSLAPREYSSGGKSDRLVCFVDLAPTVLSLAGVQPPQWLQGRAFAGKYQQELPEFIHGARGRMDERIDLVRSVTDGRYVYLRNYMPHLSQAQHVNYQMQTPSTRVWRAAYDAGKANAAQSFFWQVPKAPEELYDLEADPDTVNNLARSPAHSAVLAKLRQAQRDHALGIRDLGFVPEGELHARSGGKSPYDMAREPGKYPLERILQTAELASSLDPAALPQLAERLKDPDSAVRYWAALGYLMRGEQAAKAGQTQLTEALLDKSEYVQLVAAQTLAQFGSESDVIGGLAMLRGLLLDSDDVFVQIYTLSAIDALGKKAAPLLAAVREFNQQARSPDARYNSYTPRLAEHIRAELGDKVPPSRDATPKAKGKGKKKAK